MRTVKTKFLKIMRENRQTRIRLVLNCERSRKELFSEKILVTYFHTETIENLEAINESAVYDSFIETIEERIQNFNHRGSNWRFERVILLDIDLTDKPPVDSRRSE